MAEAQNYKNHRRIDPVHHFVGGAFLLAGTLLSVGHFGYTLAKMTSWWDVVASGGQAALTVALLISFLKLRLYALIVQDRVIALEVTDRYRQMGGTQKQILTSVLRPGQVVALRFASDGELVALTDRAIRENLPGDTIKREIKNWRADLRRV